MCSLWFQPISVTTRSQTTASAKIGKQKVQTRRVTFAQQDAVRLIPVNDLAMIRAVTRPMSIRLDRIRLPATQQTPSLPKNDKVNQQIQPSVNEAIPTLSFCRDCLESFDAIFERKQNAYLSPYEKVLAVKMKRLETASKTLKELNQVWCDQMDSWTRLGNELNHAHDKCAAAEQRNGELKALLKDLYKKYIQPEHNYAKQ